MAKDRYGVSFQVYELEALAPHAEGGKSVVVGNTRYEVPLVDLILAFTVLSHAINESVKSATRSVSASYRPREGIPHWPLE